MCLLVNFEDLLYTGICELTATLTASEIIPSPKLCVILWQAQQQW